MNQHIAGTNQYIANERYKTVLAFHDSQTVIKSRPSAGRWGRTLDMDCWGHFGNDDLKSGSWVTLGQVVSSGVPR